MTGDDPLFSLPPGFVLDAKDMNVARAALIDEEVDLLLENKAALERALAEGVTHAPVSTETLLAMVKKRLREKGAR